MRSAPYSDKWDPFRPFAAQTADFSVLQFNILADSLCMTNRHAQVPAACRVWSTRLPKILDGIARSRASIVCLQELELDLWPDFESRMLRIGYAGVYSPKVGMSGPMTAEKTIGNAVFYRVDTFQLCSSWVVPFAVVLGEECADETQRQHYTGPQVAVVVHLRSLATKHELFVASTHISPNFRDPDTQLAQVK